MSQLDFPNPPGPTHYKRGLCVNQRALITLLPTVILSKSQSYQIYHRLSDHKRSLKNLFDILLAGVKRTDISLSSDDTGGERAHSITSPPPSPSRARRCAALPPAKPRASSEQPSGSCFHPGKQLPSQQQPGMLGPSRATNAKQGARQESPRSPGASRAQGSQEGSINITLKQRKKSLR